MNAEGDPLELTRAILDSGVRIIQYRAKSGIVPAQAETLRELTRTRGALFLINDDWRAVERFDADGVHLGPDDNGFDALVQIRHALGGRIVGVSCGTPDEARAARAADYIGAGSVFATTSKSDAGDPIGLDGLREIAAATSLPVAAIGGITAENLRDVRATGVAMAAMISAFSTAPDPRAAAAHLVSTWNAA
ncbi:MAG TPA: thiamine phosphate synthase [Candidatus Rubrimentiphilum sp.]|nr:thiamine phosphate synthase [Candidatus Rubrimentiphilum sp.]